MSLQTARLDLEVRLAVGVLVHRHFAAPPLELLQAAIDSESTAIARAVALLKSLKAQLDAAVATRNLAAASAVSQALGAQTKSLAAAIAAPKVPLT